LANTTEAFGTNVAEKNWHKSAITICEQCEGKGYEDKSELEDYHKGEYRYWEILCRQCKGTGRIITKTETTEITAPYDNKIVNDLEAEMLMISKQRFYLKN